MSREIKRGKESEIKGGTKKEPGNYMERGSLILVNADYSYKSGKEALARFPGTEVYLDEEAEKWLEALLSTLPPEQIVLVSGYRSRAEQIKIFEDSIKENGLEFTKKYVARPGCSEHETGLAIDLAKKADTIDFIRPAFPYEGICQIFRERAADYGFIERYESHKEEITKISPEEWHFRYVGRPHGWIIKEKGFALEEYIEYLRQFDHYKNPLHFRYFGNEYEIYFKQTHRGDTFSSLESKNSPFDKESLVDQCVTVSGNNVDGFIITKEIRQKKTG